MRTRRISFAARLALALAFVFSAVGAPTPFAGGTAQARQQAGSQYGALERGYRTGYSDGYQSGWLDQSERRAADHRGKGDYQRADRAYQPAYGSLEDYSDGYRQGFEAGYETGYSRRDFDSNLPQAGVRRRDAGTSAAGVNTQGTTTASESVQGTTASGGPTYERRREDESESSNTGKVSVLNTGTGRRSGSIPADTVMRVELMNRLSTDVNQRGDRFEARVLEPREYEGAIIGGRLANVQRPGKARGRAELQMDFDQIHLPNGDWLDFNAQVIEVVYSGGGDDNVGDVDPEGGVRGKSSTKDDAAKVGAGAGVGAIIGGIFGGGKGAAIGAAIGAGTATGGVLTSRGKDIRLERGTQLRIRTSR